MMPVNGTAVAVTATGAVLLYSAVKGATISKTLQSFLAGKPVPGTGMSPVAGTGTGAPGGNLSHKTIADDAIQYQGASYVFGGAPAKGVGNWDCSSFVNWVIGRDLEMAIPRYKAGTYDGTNHGPVVAEWVTWSGCQTISGPPSAGDLCMWPGVGAFAHIGIAVSATHMVSALDTQQGTVLTPIKGYGPGPVVVYRRIKAAMG